MNDELWNIHESEKNNGIDITTYGDVSYARGIYNWRNNMRSWVQHYSAGFIDRGKGFVKKETVCVHQMEIRKHYDVEHDEGNQKTLFPMRT